MAWRTKIMLAELTEPMDVMVGDDVKIRVSRVAGGMAVVVDAPREKTITRTKAADHGQVSRPVE